MSTDQKLSLSATIKQSPPVDLSVPYSTTPLSNKHILITGGASGFGAAFAAKWAAAGASIVIADINKVKGTQVVADLRKQTKNENIHFVTCDVRDWKAQVSLFKEAINLSPHGGIDIVVANAGIAGTEPIQNPMIDLSVDDPPEPDYRVLDVNLYGLLYTTQLSLWYLPRNPNSKACSPDTPPSEFARDRHLLLIGSIASIGPIPTQLLYGTSKHGVLGVFRTLRASSFVDGVRVNMLCPYFIETPIMDMGARLVLSGGAMGKVEDVVDAGTRLCVNSQIMGRALCVGPKVKVRQREEDGEWIVVKKDEDGEERAVWEAYAEDFEDCELFTKRIVRLLKGAAALKGWWGWAKDVVSAIKYGIFGNL
jgi:NAD(P)-dependent dehydrogenase (short-subunit alcohol dehydrogenase family)